MVKGEIRLFWRKKGNENNNIYKDLIIQMSSLEFELTHSKDQIHNLERMSKQQSEEINQLEKTMALSKDEVQNLERVSKQQSEEINQLKKTITLLNQKEDERNNKAAKDIMSRDTKSKKRKIIIEELNAAEKENRETTIKVLKSETIELKRRLFGYVEETQPPLDHYEFALTNYRGINIPRKALRIYGYNRNAIEKLLPKEIKNNKSCAIWAKIQKDFGYGCAITGIENYDFEHFIPIHTGHGGAYEGNIIPMQAYLNSTKGNKNPFYWFRELQSRRPSLSLKRWDNLIEYLAKKHGLSVEDYFEFVNWCFTNPRTIEQLQLFNTPSIELWKRSKTIII